MNISERNKLLKQIFWDYNIPVSDIDEVLKGRKKQTGHINQSFIFRRIIESYSWFIVIQLLTPNEIRDLLTPEVIKKLRTPSLRQKYEFVRKRLHEIIPATG